MPAVNAFPIGEREGGVLEKKTLLSKITMALTRCPGKGLLRLNKSALSRAHTAIGEVHTVHTKIYIEEALASGKRGSFFVRGGKGKMLSVPPGKKVKSLFY